MPELRVVLLAWILPLLPMAACTPVMSVGGNTSAVKREGFWPAAPVFADTRWLESEGIRLGVSPSVGRITWFGRNDEKNLLWLNPQALNPRSGADPEPGGWVNHGGDKVWVGPQPLWPFFLPHGGTWPPDDSTDGPAWTVVASTDRELSMRSPVSEHAGGWIERVIRVDPAARGSVARVIILNRFHRTRPSAMPVQLWAVSQVVLPKAVYIQDDGDGRLREGWIGLSEEERFEGELSRRGSMLAWHPREGSASGKKLGVLGARVVADHGETLWIQDHFYDKDGAYPENSAAQLYVASDHVELELLSPLAAPAPGESLSHRVTWQLVPRAHVGQVSGLREVLR